MSDHAHKKTLVIGASPNPARYAFMAATRLHAAGYPVIPLGRRKGRIGDMDIVTTFPTDNDIHTVTMYVSMKHQEEYYEPILTIRPERVIFNPGTENPEFEKKLLESGIEIEEACTLVMLSTGAY
jgi:predicted CoA-binding protein